jgi:hypothetical protein
LLENSSTKLETNNEITTIEHYTIAGRQDFSLKDFFVELYKSKFFFILYILAFVAIIVQIGIYWRGTITGDSAGFLEATDYIARRNTTKDPRFLTKPLSILVAAFFSLVMDTTHAFALTSSLFTIATVLVFSYFVSKYYSTKMSVIAIVILVQLWPFNMLSSAIMTDACGYFFLILAILYTPKTIQKIKTSEKYPVLEILLNGIIFGLAILSREMLALFSFLFLLILCIIVFKKDIMSYVKVLLIGVPTLLLPAIYFLSIQINPFYLTGVAWDIHGGFTLSNPLWGPTRLVITINACFTLVGIFLAFIGFFTQEKPKQFVLNCILLFSILATLILSPVMVSRYSFTLFPVFIPLIIFGIKWIAKSIKKLPYISRIPEKFHIETVMFVIGIILFLVINAFLKIDLEAIYHLYFDSF